MSFDFRKIARWTINIGSLLVAVLTLPTFGALVPEAWLPAIGSIVAIVNLILSTIRKFTSGEALLSKPF